MLSEVRRERERQVLSSLLLEEFAYRELPEDFGPDCFEDAEHREVFGSLKKEFIETGRPVIPTEIPDEQLRGIIHRRITSPPVVLNGRLRAAAYTLQDHDRLEDLPPEEAVSPVEFSPIIGADVQKVLDQTIADDQANKLLCFLAMLTAYSEDSQMNVLFNSPSSTGKSYIPLEVVKLFPKEDVQSLGGASPRAFFHGGKFDKGREAYVVDLSRKILVFLDQPHDQLLQKLRSLLSHDEKVITYKVTDKDGKGANRTKTINVLGYPSVIFCSAALRMDQQESTRCILLSPEISQGKILKGVAKVIEREADPEMYAIRLEADPGRRMLKARIRAIREARITEIHIPEFEKELLRRILLQPRTRQPRAQRDVKRIVSLIKAFCLLNLWHRDRDDSTIRVNEGDVNEGLALWDQISESQELGLPPYLYQFFKEIIQRRFDELNPGPIAREHPTGLTRQDVLTAHRLFYGGSLSMEKLRLEILPSLEGAGLIVQEHDPENRQRRLIFPTTHKT